MRYRSLFNRGLGIGPASWSVEGTTRREQDQDEGQGLGGASGNHRIAPRSLQFFWSIFCDLDGLDSARIQRVLGGIWGHRRRFSSTEATLPPRETCKATIRSASAQTAKSSEGMIGFFESSFVEWIWQYRSRRQGCGWSVLGVSRVGSSACVQMAKDSMPKRSHANLMVGA